jgi:hypothetical protein
LLSKLCRLRLRCKSSRADKAEPASPQPPEKEKAEKQEDRTEPHLFKIIPISDLATGKTKPLSSKEKLGLFLRDARQPFIFVPPLLGTGFSEALLDNSGFGWGPAGFGKH